MSNPLSSLFSGLSVINPAFGAVGMGMELIPMLQQALQGQAPSPTTLNTNKFGNTNFATGGSLEPLSTSGTKVNANNPMALDSVSVGIANFDDSEVISGKKVFTPNFYNPISGNTFAKDAEKLEKIKGKTQKSRGMTSDLKDDKHIDKQLDSLFQVQENMMTTLGLRQPSITPAQQFATGGILGGTDPYDDVAYGTPTYNGPMSPNYNYDNFLTNTFDLFPSQSKDNSSSVSNSVWNNVSPFDKMYAGVGAVGVGLDAVRSLQPSKTYSPASDNTPITQRRTSPYEANKRAQEQYNAVVDYIANNTRGMSQNVASRLQALSNIQSQQAANEFTADQQNQAYRTEYEQRKAEQTRYNNAQRLQAEQFTDQSSAARDQGIQSLIQSGLNLAGSIRTGGNQALMNTLGMSLLGTKDFKLSADNIQEYMSLINSPEFKNASGAERQRMLAKYKQ